MEKKKEHEQKEELPFRIYPLGDAGIVLQFGEQISPKTLSHIKAFASSLEMYPIPGYIEAVPAYTTLTIYYNPWLASEQGLYDAYDKVVQHIRYLASLNSAASATNSTLIEIPVCYGGDFGPDLDFVAKHTRLTPAELISLHTAPEYLVYMIGFVPGFPYLGGMDTQIAAPRKVSPSPRIPAGAVGIAGTQTGVYPLETPGGWQIIGRTPTTLFDPLRAQPSLLQAGDRVRFTSISIEEYTTQKAATHES